MDTTKYLSPSIRWDGQKYQMWSIGFGKYNTTGSFVYQESNDGKNWSKEKRCSIGNNNSDLAIWHGSVNYDTEQQCYEFVYIPDSSDSQTIEYCTSKDGVNFTPNETIVQNNKNTLWKHLYRPCLMSENGRKHLFYGVITEENKWYISYSHGTKIHELQGIDEKDCEKMIQMNDFVTDTHDFQYRIKKVYHSIRDYIRPEVGVIIIFVLCFELIFKKRNIYEMIVCTIICVVYTYLRLRPQDIYGICINIAVGVIEGICIFSVAGTLTNRR